MNSSHASCQSKHAALVNAGHKPALFGIDRSLINAWAARTAAERPSNVVPSALERVAFGQGAATGADGTEWAVLSERDEAHLTGLLELINQTGELEVRLYSACLFEFAAERGGVTRTCFPISLFPCVFVCSCVCLNLQRRGVG